MAGWERCTASPSPSHTQMISRFLLSGLAGASLFVSALSWAQTADIDSMTTATIGGDTAPAASAVSAAVPESNRLGEALTQAELISGSVSNTQASYYVFASVASWSEPGVALMPKIVKTYAEMQQEGKVQLVLVPIEFGEKIARDFVRSYSPDCPALLQTEATKLPGFILDTSVPSGIILDADGNFVASGKLDFVTKYKAYITKYEVENNLELTYPPSNADTQESQESQVRGKLGSAVAALHSITATKPRGDAQFYAFYFGASTCCGCKDLIGDVAAFYAEMMVDGRVELVYVSFDRSKSAALKFFRSVNAWFPSVLATNKALGRLPGFSMPIGGAMSTVLILDADGKKVASGGANDILTRWKELTVGKQ